jgi:hypothetical protein
VGKAKLWILFDLFDLITLFQIRIFEAFSHVSVVNVKYVFIQMNTKKIKGAKIPRVIN